MNIISCLYLCYLYEPSSVTVELWLSLAKRCAGPPLPADLTGHGSLNKNYNFFFCTSRLVFIVEIISTIFEKEFGKSRKQINQITY